MSLKRWLLDGADENTMPDTWMRERLPEYVAYTRQQLDQGRVVTDSKEMGYRAFWEAVAAKREQRAVIRQFGRGRA